MSNFVFSEFDIKPNVKTFVGEKIKVKNIINVQIKVIDFKIEPSKQKPGTDLLTVQIEWKGDQRIFFTGSTILMDQIQRVPKAKFPFTTTIINDNSYYEFT
jgi:hypothetical protein